MTHHLRSLADHWRDLNGLPDDRVIDLLRQDRLDILVFLAGHFDQNRPELCRHRLAPVQVSFHDGTSSGFDAMDWWLTDAFLHPEEHGLEQFTETLYRLPCFYQYAPPEPTMIDGTPPVDQMGFLTFASFNLPAKINDPVLHTWGAVLNAVPDSRLFLKYRTLRTPDPAIFPYLKQIPVSA